MWCWTEAIQRPACFGLVGWAERQFRSMDRADSRDLAIALVASYQGISLLTNTFRDPELMVREGRRLERWIDSLTGGSSPRVHAGG